MLGNVTNNRTLLKAASDCGRFTAQLPLTETYVKTILVFCSDQLDYLLHTAGQKKQETNTETHDVGFMVYDSFGKGLEYTRFSNVKSSWKRREVIAVTTTNVVSVEERR